MSSRFASEQLASLRHDAQRLLEQAGDQEGHALTWLAVEDVNVASRSPARLLITASTPQAVETLARRIHGIGPPAQFPFVVTCAGGRLTGAQALRDHCARHRVPRCHAARRHHGRTCGRGGCHTGGPEGCLQALHRVGEALIARLRTFREHGGHVLGSFIFGLPSDRPSTFQATVDVANRAELAFAQFVMLTPDPGTVDFEAWEKRVGPDAAHIGGVPITRHWLIPQERIPANVREYRDRH